MKLRLLMIFILAPGILAAGYFAFYAYQGKLDDRDNSVHTRMLAYELSFVANLVHELQRERGYSAGHVSSDGANFAADLADQRSRTDTALREAIANNELLNPVAQRHFDAAMSMLEELQEMRAAVVGLETTVPDLAGYYTDAIGELLEVGGLSSQDINNRELLTLLLAGVHVSLAKEAAGLERAMGATGLGQGQFSVSVYTNFNRLFGRQSIALQIAGEELGDESFVDQIQSSESAQAIQEMREQIINSIDGGELDDLAAAEWFATSTEWVDYLRDIEVELFDSARELAREIEATATADLRRHTFVAAIALLAAAAFAIIGFEYMIYRIKGLTRAMDRFTHGEFDVWIPSIRGRDEIGRMANAVYRFKQETLAMRKAAAEQKAADEAQILGKAQEVVELVTEGLDALAKSDLTRHFENPLSADYDSIRTDYNSAAQNLRAVLSQIAQTAGSLEDSAAGLQGAAGDLGHRTTEQVDTIRDTATRVGELSSEVEGYGEDVRTASGLAGAAKEKADRSGEIVRQTVEAMDRISDSSSRISQIIEMIEDISFQTNLLALNAGVEAARAGESGKGFAVVAQEVGELARRSSNAANEIKSLITESTRQVTEGVSLVGEAGTALNAIFEDIMRVDDVLARVSTAAEQQVGSLRDFADAMTRINDLADQNTQMADETARASVETAESAKQLTQLIGDFSLGSASELPGASGRRAA